MDVHKHNKRIFGLKISIIDDEHESSNEASQDGLQTISDNDHLKIRKAVIFLWELVIGKFWSA